MKKTIVFLLITISITTYGQDFKDKIITLENDTINCNITLINNNNIFFEYKEIKTVVSKYISLTLVKSYLLDKNSITELLIIKDTSQTVQLTINNILTNNLKKELPNKTALKLQKGNDSIISIISNEYNTLNKKIENINSNMQLCHQEYRSGTSCIIIGLITTVVGSIVFIEQPTVKASNQIRPTTNVVPLFIGCAGFVLTTVGGILQIDSHKYIGRGYKK